MEDKKIYFAVKAFILNEGKFLVMHKTGVEENVWELPGGRMEFGETAEETLKREILEDAGLLVTPVRVLDTWNFVAENYQITGIIYLCKSKNSEVRISDEHDKYKWVDADNNAITDMHKVFSEKMARWNWKNVKFEQL